MFFGNDSLGQFKLMVFQNANGRGLFGLILKNKKSEIFFFCGISVVLLEGAGWLYASLMCQAA